MQTPQTIWTIGHSTRTLDAFFSMLEMHAIRLLVDIRSYPGSRRFPHFNKESLSISLPEKGIEYKHMAGLGGRRKPAQNSHNAAWRNASFRGYADHMESEEFKSSIVALETLAAKTRTAYMCSEAPWWRCHRALVSDYLKIHGWIVLHIMEKGKVTEHPYTSAARPAQGELFYHE